MISVAFVLTYVWLFFSDKWMMSTDCYPLWIVRPKYAETYVQTYIDYAMARVLLATLLFYRWQALPKWGNELRIFFWLFVGYIIDYLLTFNQPLIYLVPFEFTLDKPEWPGFYIPLGYPLVMVSIMFYISWTALKKWKHYRSFK